MTTTSTGPASADAGAALCTTSSAAAATGEVAPESEAFAAREAAPEPVESEMAPAEERPSMLSRLASWRAPEPEPEMEREGETEAPAPPQDEPRQLPCDHHHCRAPPGRLGLAFKDSTRVVGGLLPPYTSVLCGTVYPGDELVSVNDCVVADDDFLGVLTAQDDGATARALVFQRAAGGTPKTKAETKPKAGTAEKAAKSEAAALGNDDDLDTVELAKKVERALALELWSSRQGPLVPYLKEDPAHLLRALSSSKHGLLDVAQDLTSPGAPLWAPMRCARLSSAITVSYTHLTLPTKA